MKTSEEINELATALAKAQGKLKSIEKNSTVQIKMNSGGSFSFQYATLDNVIDGIRGPFSENGLSIVQAPTLDETGLHLVTRIMHNSGQWIECELNARPGDKDMKALGSVITYLRRYSITAMAGVASDEDTDGKGEQQIEAGQKQARANGKADDANTPSKILVLLNRVDTIKGYYNNVTHLKNTLKQEYPGGFEWPDKEDKNSWREVYVTLRDYAIESKKGQAEKVADSEPTGMDEIEADAEKPD